MLTIHKQDGIEVPSGLRVVEAARGNEVYDEDSFLAYRRLRAGIYIGQRNFLSIDHMASDGGEILDSDDSRSVHMVHMDGDTAVGAVRFIVRGNKPLPVEDMFDVTIHDPRCFEISRFMAEHPDPAVKAQIRVELIGLSLAFAINTHAVPYAVIERPFSVLMQRTGLVLSGMTNSLGEPIGPQRTAKYNDTANIPVRINVVESIHNALELDARKGRDVGRTWDIMTRAQAEMVVAA